MSIAATALQAADKAAAFRAAPAASYSHQTNDRVTIGVDAYASGDKVKAAFGKLDPYQYGLLPVLVVIQNDSGKTIKLDRMKAEYVAGNNRVEATPAREVRYINGPNQPKVPGPVHLPSKKNPLEAWEIEGRAFAAVSLPSGNSAFGFFYFQAALKADATIYISGMTDAGTGVELLYFDVPLK